MIEFIKKNYIFHIVFFVGLITSLTFNFNNVFEKISSFDQQTIETWKFFQLKGLLPFKDFFYPYGLFAFLVNSNVILKILNVLIFPTSLIIFLKILTTVNKNKLFAYASLSLIYLFTIIIIGFETFNRYSIFLLTSIIAAFVIYKYENNKLIYLILGLIFPSLFLLFIDQGAYSFIVFIFLCISKIFINNKSSFNTISRNLFIFIVSFIFGLFPPIIFLKENNLLDGFIYFLKHFNEMTLFAKTPFYSYATQPENLFIFLVIFLTTINLSYQFIFLKKNFKLINFVQLALLFAVVLIEQKSIIRSMSITVYFYAYVLFIFLIGEMKVNYKNTLHKFVMLIFIFTPLLFVHSNINFNEFNKKVNLNNQYNFTEEQKLIKEINTQNTKKQKIFIYPGDPILYTYTNQMPPFYTSIYEASSLEAQNNLIAYLRSNDVSEVFMNSRNTAIQDGVPNYLRAQILTKYILNNYKINKLIGDFIILKKDSASDFILDIKQTNFNNYFTYLTKVNLGFIPRSEGIFKYIFTNKDNHLINGLNNHEVNKYLKNNELTSNDKAIILKSNYKLDKNKSSMIKIYSEDNLSSEIDFNSCDKYCIINLSRIPLFYKNRRITKIEMDDKMYNLSIISLTKDDFENLW